jgi:hypothetical protein
MTAQADASHVSSSNPPPSPPPPRQLAPSPPCRGRVQVCNRVGWGGLLARLHTAQKHYNKTVLFTQLLLLRSLRCLHTIPPPVLVSRSRATLMLMMSTRERSCPAAMAWCTRAIARMLATEVCCMTAIIPFQQTLRSTHFCVAYCVRNALL